MMDQQQQQPHQQQHQQQQQQQNNFQKYSHWAIESIDFSSLEEDFTKEPLPSMLNNCSTAGTLSTAGESSSEWDDSDLLEFDSFFQEHLRCSYASIPSSSTATIPEETSSLEDSENSLDLDDLTAFAKEDKVGIYDPERRDELPPPKPRTDFKGDSQNSFTLDDLEVLGEEQHGRSKNKCQRSGNYKNDQDGSFQLQISEASLSSNFSPSTEKPLKGILKYASNQKASSSLAMQMMEQSGMFNLSLNDSLELDVYEEDRNDQDDDDNINAWALMQQSFGRDCNALDLSSLEEKSVSFSSVSIHEHPIICGDNPSVSEGVPLTMDWKAEFSHTFASLEAYEETKATQSGNNTKIAKRREAEERMWLLLNAGISLKDIQHAEMIANRARQEREATKQQHLLMLAHKSAAFAKAIQVKEEEEEEWKRTGSTLNQRKNNRLTRGRRPEKDASERRTTIVVSPERNVDTPTAKSA